MASHREKDATDYLEKHKILELVDNLTSMLLFHKPENPREFLIEQLEQLKIYRLGLKLFNSSDVTAVLRILDPTDKHYITFEQYKHALTLLGIKDINECPEGVNENRISHETFRTEVMIGLERNSATYAQL